MRITFVLPHANLAGGIRVIAIYADRLAKRGHRVHVVSTPMRPLRFKQRARYWLKGQRPPRPEAYDSTYFANLPVDHRVIDRCRRITDADVPDADVVVATWWETAYWVNDLSPRKGAKAYFMQDYGAAGQELEHLCPTWALPLHLITISQWLADLITRYQRVSVDLVPNGVDLDKYAAPPRTKQPVPTVGFVYHNLPDKGIDLLARAVTLARIRYPHLHLVGFGLYPPRQPLPLIDHGYFIWNAPDDRLPDIYAACDAWLFGSYREGFGLPILEAMACRTPVIATPAGAAPELLAGGGGDGVGDGVGRGVGGILLPDHQPQNMARAIETICVANEAQWRTMSQAAYATARQYTWQRATDLFEAALKRAVARDAGAGHVNARSGHANIVAQRKAS